jgi:cytochrome c oxidase cbb3-type subunit 3
MRFRWVLLLLLGLLVGNGQATPDGKALYLENCAACHQFSGAGGIGLPLTENKFRDYSNDYLFKTIRMGRPGRIMPAFQEMSDAQVKAIIGFLRTRTHTKERTYDPTPLEGNAAHGKELFERNCVVCHAENGLGAGQGTGVTLSRDRSFLVMPAAIANPSFQKAATDRMIKQIISVGRESSGMPAFGKRFSEKDIEDLVAYVRVLGSKVLERPRLAKDEPPSHVYESPYDFETTVENVKQTLIGNNFRIFPERYLEQGVTDEFEVNPKQIGIRFCNFNSLYGMLNIEPRLGVVLPCRVTIMERADGTVLLVVPNLRVVSRWFNNDQLVELWDRMEDTFNQIIEEATL